MAQQRGKPSGLRLGRVLGVPVLLQPSWFVFAAAVVVLYASLFDERGGNGYVAAAAFAVLLLVSVILHELGHCVVARVLGLPVRSVSVTFLAGVTEITEPPQTPAREYAVAVAGPLVSLLLTGLFLAGAGLAGDGTTGELVLLLLGYSNALVAAVNLLPGLPLDGGRVLRAIVWRVSGSALTATVASAQAGRLIAVVVIPGGLLVALPLAGGDVTLVGAALTGLIAAFVYVAATTALRGARSGQRLLGVTAASLARPALSATPDLPLSEALRLTGERGLHAVVVVDPDGRARAIVSESRVLEVPAHRRAWVAVSTLAREVEPGLVLDATLSGDALLAALAGTPAEEYLVAGGGSPRVLSAADVASRLAQAPR